MGLLSSYPDGPGHVLTAWPIANPAAGAEISCVVPAGRIWLINSIAYSFQTAVAAATRRSNLIMDLPTGEYSFDDGNINTQTASLLYLYQFYMAGAVDRTPIAVPTVPVASVWALRQTGILPQRLLLGPGTRIRTLTNNIQAADQYFVTGATSGLFNVVEFRQN